MPRVSLRQTFAFSAGTSRAAGSVSSGCWVGDLGTDVRRNHGRRNLVGFAITEADAAAPVTYDDERAEGKSATALYDGRAAEELDQIVVEHAVLFGLLPLLSLSELAHEPFYLSN